MRFSVVATSEQYERIAAAARETETSHSDFLLKAGLRAARAVEVSQQRAAAREAFRRRGVGEAVGTVRAHLGKVMAGEGGSL